jgi:hypothetical protein
LAIAEKQAAKVLFEAISRMLYLYFYLKRSFTAVYCIQPFALAYYLYLQIQLDWLSAL